MKSKRLSRKNAQPNKQTFFIKHDVCMLIHFLVNAANTFSREFLEEDAGLEANGPRLGSSALTGTVVWSLLREQHVHGGDVL